MKRLILAVLFLAVASSAYAIWPFSRPTYTLTVINGSGSGSYKAGTMIALAAVPRSDASFTAWLSTDTAKPTDSSTWGTHPERFEHVNDATTMFVMPKTAVTIQATYLLP